MKQMHWLLMLAIISIVVNARSFIVPTQARNDTPTVRFEYAWVHVPNKGRPLLIEAEGETTVYPSRKTLSGLARNMKEGPLGYRLQTRLVRSDQAGVLDIAGLDGWEAVNMISDLQGIKVLLKRPL
jgi:hypothetical protein